MPIAIALGFDKPSPGLMERKPRPLSQPVLSRSQWVRIAIIGILMAIGTLLLEARLRQQAPRWYPLWGSLSSRFTASSSA